LQDCSCCKHNLRWCNTGLRLGGQCPRRRGRLRRAGGRARSSSSGSDATRQRCGAFL
jgi:hypothetical protein